MNPAEEHGREARADRIARRFAEAAANRGRRGSTIARSNAPAAPLSFEQQRLWPLAAQGAAYNSAMRVELDGSLDPAGLEAALGAVIAHQPMLRTSFHEGPDGPYQQVHENVRVLLDIRDAAGRDVEAELAEAAECVFDLAAAPLLRAVLWRRPGRDLLLVVIHHLATDGWFRVFFDDLSAAYAGRNLEPLPVHYADYARHQRAQFAEGLLNESVSAFAARLAGAEPLDLPGDRAGLDRAGSGETPLRIGRELADAIRELATRRRVSPFTVLLAGLHTVLFHYTRGRDVTVGVPADGRDDPDLAGLLGFFVNLLPVRARVAPGQPFTGFLDRVRDEWLEAFEHRTVPLEPVLEAARGQGCTWVPSVVLNFDPAGGGAVELGGVSGTADGVDTGIAKFDLNIYLSDTGSGFDGCVIYRRAAFTEGAARAFADQFVAVLTAAVQDPERPVLDLPLASEAELSTPSPAAQYPVRSLTVWFAEAARRDPSAVAVVCEDHRVTYRELDAWSNRLARRLREHGARPGAFVGLQAERSVELVAGLLAILKAGAAYLPLDPAYPRSRLAELVGDSGTRLVLGQGTGRTAPAGAAWIELDPADQYPDTPLEVEVSPHHPAYVIYTSGSSGRPKGVVVTHGNVSRLLSATEPWFGFGPQDVWTLFHSFAFDFSVWELWGALAYGGKLVVVPKETSRAADRFLDLLDRERVTVCNQTPSAFAQLTEAAVQRGAGPDALRLVVFGGEALEFDKLEPWYALVPAERTRLVNMYGITETTVHVTYRRVEPADVAGGTGSLIGEPIPDLSLALLDARGRPVPAGVPGEIHVGGAGVAAGYLGDPRKTAERFVPDEAGARRYRSGDLACRTGDGELRYLGRADQQVKIRGFRIELGEVAAAVRRHPEVAEAAVLVRHDPGRAEMLVGYAVPAPGSAPPAPQEVLGFVAGLLPAHAVPAAVVLLDALPMTVNGKLDRNRLPAPEFGGEAHEAPRDETERQLLEIITALLGVPDAGVTDDFYGLGLDSITAMQAAARARTAGLRVGPADLITCRTVRALAEHLSAGATVAAPRRVRRTTAGGQAALLPMQAWLREQGLDGSAPWHQSVWLSFGRDVEPSAVQAAIEAVAATHPALRAPAGSAGLVTRADLGTVPAAHRPRALARAVEACGTEIDLAAGALIRGLIVEGLPGGRHLLLVAHHDAVDAVSWNAIIEDLDHTLPRVAAGIPAALPEDPGITAEFAAELAAYTRTPEAAAERAQWIRALSVPADRIPVANPGAHGTEQTADTAWRVLDRRRTALLAKDAPRILGANCEEILLAAALTALAEWSGARRIRLDMERHGREPLDGGLDPIRAVGWYTAIFPLEVDCAGRAPDVLARTATALRAVPHRGNRYAALRHLGAPADRAALAALEEPQIAFNYLGRRAARSARGVFQPCDPPLGLRAAPQRDPRAVRTRLLAVEAVIEDGQARIGWTYDDRTGAAAADLLADTTLEQLETLVDRCLSRLRAAFA